MERDFNIVSLISSLHPKHHARHISNISLRRSGTPHWSSISSSPNAPEWSANVSWEKGDVLDPSSYTSHLEGADAVIHSMGILLEADYKGVVSGRESPIRGLQRAFSSTKAGTQNPLDLKSGETLRPQERDGQLTYEVMNRDTGIVFSPLYMSQHIRPKLSHLTTPQP